MRSFVLNHLLPISAALIVSLYLINSGYLFPKEDSAVKSKSSEIVSVESGRYARLTDDPQSVSDFQFALKNKSLLVLGSSELSASSDYTPWRFIPSKLKFPVLAIGHEGNQCLSILTQLAANRKYIQDSKINIILSPGWFEDKPTKGTSLQVFFEYNSESFLQHIYYDKGLDETYKNYINSYIEDKFTEMSSTKAIHRLMYDKSRQQLSSVHKILYKPMVFFNSWIIELRDTFENSGNDIGEFSDPVLSNIATRSGLVIPDSLWVEMLEKSVLVSASKSTNNDWGIENKYYDEYIQGRRGKLIPVELSNNQEYRDYLMLLKFLKDHGVRASFIIQPVNSLYFDGIEALSPLMNELGERALEHGFPVLNLFVDDPENYNKALLSDVMHMDDYSWILMDRFLINSYDL